MAEIIKREQRSDLKMDLKISVLKTFLEALLLFIMRGN